MITPVGSTRNEAYALAIQSDDRIVAAGFASDGVNTSFALARYNTKVKPVLG